MNKIDNKIKTYTQIISFLIIWSTIVIFSGTYDPKNLLPAIKQIPQAIGVYAIAGLIFTKWIWRWKALQGWLIKIPDLQGTWRGELESDWIDPVTNKGIAPIPITLVIRQTFSDIKCTLMTGESSSYSSTAEIGQAFGGEDLYLTYIYTNRPKATVRERSEIHEGATTLKIIRKPSLSLEGDYWTDRKTRGRMKLSFQSKELVEKF